MSINQITLTNLQTGDLIVSRKAGNTLYQSLFNSCVESVGKRRYGDSGVYLESNHVRVFLKGDWRNFVLRWLPSEDCVFHWTHPKSRIDQFETWMLDPNYAVICRPKFTVAPWDIYDYVAFAVNRRYNYGLLLDIFLGLSFELFSLDLDNEVCSTGAAESLSIPEQRRYIPADFINNGEFEMISVGKSVEQLREEPIRFYKE